jgi:hypothetical protein
MESLGVGRENHKRVFVFEKQAKAFAVVIVRHYVVVAVHDDCDRTIV